MTHFASICLIVSIYIAGQVYSQNLRNRLDLSSSTEGPDTEDNNYLGYSLAIGDFTGSGRADLAVGMPRSANLTGKVKSCSKITSPPIDDNHYHILSLGGAVYWPAIAPFAQLDR